MKKTFLAGLVIFLLLSGCQVKRVTKISVGPGWAKTMVNATIFRKNAVVSHGGFQYVAYYDSSATVILAKRKLGSANWQISRTQYTGNALDAHNVINIMIDDDGYLHMAWDHHNNNLNYCRSTEPGSLVMGPPQPMVGRNESSVSYPEFYRLPSGNLIVPVIRNADMLNLTGLTKAVNDLALRARNNQLKPEEISGGTYTITNVGSFGNVMGTPIINQPQVAIMATGAIRKKPAVLETPEGDVIAIRHMIYLSHSYDHRVVDGALGGSFLRKVADYLEQFDVNRSI